jgi:hypothetical protein
VLCAAIQEITELRDALEQQIHGVRSGRRRSMRKRLR